MQTLSKTLIILLFCVFSSWAFGKTSLKRWPRPVATQQHDGVKGQPLYAFSSDRTVARLAAKRDKINQRRKVKAQQRKSSLSQRRLAQVNAP